jgi:hypothetical protein
MTSRDDSAAESSARAALQLLATLYDRTKDIFPILNKNPAVTEVTHECRAGRSSDFMTEQAEYHFWIYVDATTHDDESFCWCTSVVLTSDGWELGRAITTPPGQRNLDVRFEDVSFKTFDELAANCSALMDELVASAKTFDFDNPYGTTLGRGPA